MLESWLAEITEALDKHNQAHPEQPAALLYKRLSCLVNVAGTRCSDFS